MKTSYSITIAAALGLVVGAFAGNYEFTPADVATQPGEISIPAPGSSIPTKVFPVKLADGTRCVIVQNGYRGVGIDCKYTKEKDD